MKKLYILLLAGLMGVNYAKAQNVSFTIKPGATNTSAKVFFKSNAALSGVVSQILVTLTLSSSVAPAAPTPSFTTNASFAQWGALSLNPATTENVNGVSSYVYTFFAAPVTSTTTATAIDVETLLGDVVFPDGIDISTLRLSSLANGGGSTISYLVWEVGGEIKSNPTAIVYGCGAVNSASGFEGYSFVPLACVTPVNFLSFYAIKNGDDAKLNWTVENDQDNNYFEVQRSLNGITYSTINKVNAMKNGRSSNTYELADPRLSGLGSATVYYRIKQVDNNGTITYSQIRNLNLTLSLDAVNLYPNPAKTVTKLVWDVQAAGKGTLILRDATGRQVQTIAMELVKGINQRDINVSTLPSGEYTVTVLGANNFSKTIKLTKIN